MPEIDRNLKRHMFASMLSFGVMGISGIVLNILIGWFWGVAALGVFNQVFTLYIFFSQLATLGVHQAALTFVAGEQDETVMARIIRDSLGATLVLASATTLLFAVTAVPLSGILDSPKVAEGVWWATPGLFFFALNKTLLAVLNGRRKMEVFFGLQSLRYIALVATVGSLVPLGDAAVAQLAMAFSVAEILVFVPCLLLVWPLMRFNSSDTSVAGTPGWTSKILWFGLRGSFSGILSELNTRVDILILGIFVSDAGVGLYSFAAVLAEGLYQAVIMVRSVFAPRVIDALQNKNAESVSQISRQVLRVGYGLVVLGGVLGVTLYSWAVDLLGLADKFGMAWELLAILIVGIVVGGGYISLNQILLWGKRPGAHSLYICSVIVVNILGNLILIPYYHAMGAAVATAIAYAYAALMVPLTARWLLGVRP